MSVPFYSRRFDTRALAVQWAEEERKAIEADTSTPWAESATARAGSSTDTLFHPDPLTHASGTDPGARGPSGPLFR